MTTKAEMEAYITDLNHSIGTLRGELRGSQETEGNLRARLAKQRTEYRESIDALKADMAGLLARNSHLEGYLTAIADSQDSESGTFVQPHPAPPRRAVLSPLQRGAGADNWPGRGQNPYSGMNYEHKDKPKEWYDR